MTRKHNFTQTYHLAQFKSNFNLQHNKNLIFNSFFTFMLEILTDQYVSIMHESYLS